MRKSIWNLCGFQLQRVLLLLSLVLHLHCSPCLSLNLEGLALLAFHSKVDVDPHGALSNWNAGDDDPCGWFGVHCIDNKVETLNLKGMSLGGTLTPELGKLSHLRSLVLHMNHFSGAIPKEIGELTMLKLLDLRGNNFSGLIPAELEEMISREHLLLCGDEFQDSMSLVGNLNRLSDLKCEQSLRFPVDLGFRNRKLGHWFRLKKNFPSNAYGEKHGVNILILSEPYIEDNIQHSATSAHRKLLEVASNLPAKPLNGFVSQEAVDVPSIGSGSFPAVPKSIGGPKDSLPDSVSSTNMIVEPSKPVGPVQNHSSFIGGLGKVLIFVVLGVAIHTALIAGFLARRRSVSMSKRLKTGLSGPLQKVFVAGVPKLNRSELEAACEDFSNIIITLPNCIIFKGILSSGVEIEVVSTVLTARDWSKRSEAHFRRKVDILSRINHKNYINLLGYCEENEPFTRMMVFEYTPNGALSEHLNGEEREYLDWNARMRIIMGIAYCLQYMHHELNPPVATADLRSDRIYMTDDYAAKLCDSSIWGELVARRKRSFDEDIDPSDSPFDDPAANVYTFGLLMLEIISGRVQHSEEGGSIRNWAAEYLNDKNDIQKLVDPTVKAFNNDELAIICEVIQECIHGDAKCRPTMKEITTKLKEGLGIPPEAACPRLSPLWWAELEILSVEES